MITQGLPKKIKQLHDASVYQEKVGRTLDISLSVHNYGSWYSAFGVRWIQSSSDSHNI